jgi:predicted ATPase
MCSWPNTPSRNWSASINLRGSIDLEAEFDNIRTALEWSLITDVEGGLRLASALRWFWLNSTHINESNDYLSRLLQSPPPLVIAPAIRAKALAV